MYYIVNVQGIITDGKRFLLAKRSEEEEHVPGTWGFPGGKVEGSSQCGNVLEETLRRELLEEICLEVGKITYMESVRFTADDGDVVVNILFVCEYIGGDPKANDPMELSDVKWMTAAMIRENPDIPAWTKRYAERALLT